jgi:hypothetical protein
MQSIEELQLLEDIKNCEKNIKAGKEALENVKKYLYQEEQFLILYKKRIERIRNAK